jgi:hypothetical protein
MHKSKPGDWFRISSRKTNHEGEKSNNKTNENDSSSLSLGNLKAKGVIKLGKIVKKNWKVRAVFPGRLCDLGGRFALARSAFHSWTNAGSHVIFTHCYAWYSSHALTPWHFSLATTIMACTESHMHSKLHSRAAVFDNSTTLRQVLTSSWLAFLKTGTHTASQEQEME